MKTVLGIVFIFVFPLSAVLAQKGDGCHVYVIDIAMAEKAGPPILCMLAAVTATASPLERPNMLCIADGHALRFDRLIWVDSAGSPLDCSRPF